jgi:hypothetical protein
MPTVIKQPTANQSPDPGQAGDAVSGPTNTGHAETTVQSVDGAPSNGKSCIWTTFQTNAVPPVSLSLKVTWSADGLLSGIGATNGFAISYSLNGGGSWNSLVNQAAINGPAGATASATLSVLQDISQVQVRDFMLASTSDIGEQADLVLTVSSIQLELQFADVTNLLVMGM